MENRDGVFPIHRSYKFNPIVLQKGGETDAINTAFMRRKLEDWEHGEDIATPYSRERVERFSPNSRAILEIQSARDLEILEKIYANGVLLGDDGPDGWGITYTREFDMTNDSHLFPPRPEWEAKGYRPDEYSRWLLGDWRPMEELWEMLGVDPTAPEPAEVKLEDWLFDASAGPDRREAEAQFVHGHRLKPGDVTRTDWQLRCAQPPYDRLPMPRARIPAGIVLSREADAWIREDTIGGIALPFFEGRMIGPFDYSEKGWVSGKGRGSVWRGIPWHAKRVEPQYLMSATDYHERIGAASQPKVAHMRIGSATNERTAIGAMLCGFPTGDTAATFYLPDTRHCILLAAIINSALFDFVTRARVTGLHLDYHVWAQNPLPKLATSAPVMAPVFHAAESLCYEGWSTGLAAEMPPQHGTRALTLAERVRITAMLDALIAHWVGLDYVDLRHILQDCDQNAPSAQSGLDPKGFWRVDRDLDPALRRTNLALVAFHNLQQEIQAAGDTAKGLGQFLSRNGGYGWTLPESLRLADYGLGDGKRAVEEHPVAQRLGPRFLDWQLAQTQREAERESQLHRRNLLGADRYHQFVANRPSVTASTAPRGSTREANVQLDLKPSPP